MTQTPEERKAFLAEFNEIAKYTATVLHGDDVSKVRIKQMKQYFNRTYNMLNRIAVKDEINNKSFRFGYGGKILVRKVMLELGIIERIPESKTKALYRLKVHPGDINLELVSRIIVEVYLSRNDIRDL
ncbi:MAG: hypothetical protein P8P74_16375 [Crocinitomicaceae bacterium]|nr:hypothetical protein [Crocinitomicaceae bacterium]